MNSNNAGDITHVRPTVSITCLDMAHHKLARQFIVRRPTMQDAAAVTGLINICTVAETGTLNMTVTALEAVWCEAAHGPMIDAWLVQDAAGCVVGYGELDCSPNCAAPNVWVYVHPDAQAVGIGAHLLRTAEAQVRKLKLRRAGQKAEQELVLQAVVVSLNQGLRRLLHRQGFTLVARYWDFAAVPPELAQIARRAYAPDEDGQQVARYDVYEKALTAEGKITHGVS